MCRGLGYVVTRYYSKTVVTTGKTENINDVQVNSHSKAAVESLLLLHSSELQTVLKDTVLHVASSFWATIHNREGLHSDEVICRSPILLQGMHAPFPFLGSVIQSSNLIACIKLDVSAGILRLPLLFIR